MKLLLLSNGHGEDAIAARIITRLQQSPHCPQLVALPLVGEGYAYTRVGVSLLGEVRKMPSGGFIYRDIQQLGRDLRGGLLGLTSRQYRLVRDWAKDGGKILAVGDIIPLALAWLSKAQFAFVGTAKSEYYLRTSEKDWLESATWLDRYLGSYYYPWECWLMMRPLCQAVFPRDHLTYQILQRRSIRVIDAGNPMMDELIFPVHRDTPTDSLTILLLAGSRFPESLENLQRILEAVAGIINQFTDYKLKFVSAMAPALEIDPFREQLIDRGWREIANDKLSFTYRNASLTLSQSAYAEYLTGADLAIAMAGTATEQFVGLGKPAITIEGKGPQFTPHFARLQGRLLGCSVILVSHPEQVADKLRDLLKDQRLWREISENGQIRMGKPGASAQIAHWIIHKWA